MKQARVYSLKVWLTAVLIAPVFLGTYQAIVYDGGFVWWVFYGVLFGGTLGAPSFVLLYRLLIDKVSGKYNVFNHTIHIRRYCGYMAL